MCSLATNPERLSCTISVSVVVIAPVLELYVIPVPPDKSLRASAESTKSVPQCCTVNDLILSESISNTPVPEL